MTTAPLAVLDNSIHHNTVVPGTDIEIHLPANAKSLAIKYLMHARIHPDPKNPRKYAADEIEEMSASIAVEGVQQPITVRPIPEGIPGACPECGRSWAELAGKEHMIIYGERRWRGSLGILNFVPAMVRTDHEEPARRLLAQLVENFQRKNLSPLEEAYGYRDAMHEDPTLTQAELSRVTGKSRSSITDRLALLRNVAWVPLLESGEITVSQMVEVSRYADRSATDHSTAIRVARDVAGVDRRIADLEIARFRELVTTVMYFDPNAPAPTTKAADLEPSKTAAPLAAAVTSVSDSATVATDDASSDAAVGGVVREEDLNAGDGGESSSVETREEMIESSEPAYHEEPAANGPSGTALAGPGIPSGNAEAPSSSVGSDEHAAELPATGLSSRGVFAALAPVVPASGVTIMLFPGASAGLLRVTMMSAALKQPFSADGTADDLDAELPDAIEAAFSRAGARPVAEKPAAKASAAQAQSTPAKQSTAVAAEKATPEPAPKPKAPAKPRGPAPLYPDALLTAAMPGHVAGAPTKLPAAEKAVRAYAKANDLIGTGTMKTLISCDDTLRALFGAPIVKLAQLQKLLKPHLVSEPVVAATAAVDKTQIDIVDMLDGEE